MSEIELGHTVVDKITGLVGIVTGRVEYLHGETSVLVSPKVTPEGIWVKSRWISEGRLRVQGIESETGFDHDGP